MNKHKIALLVTLISAFVITLLIVILILIKSQLIIAKVNIGGVDVSFKSKLNAYQIINSKMPNHIKLSHKNQVLFEGDKNEIGLIFDPIKSVLEAGKINRSIKEIAYAKNISIPVVISENTLKDKINKLPDGYVNSQDARLEITNGIITEVTEINGMEFDFDRLSTDISDNPFSGQYQLNLTKSYTDIKTIDLASAKIEAENILKTNLSLVSEKKVKANINASVIGNLIGFSKQDNNISAIIDNEKLDNYLSLLKGKLSIKASPIIRYQNGDIVDNGKDGSELNIEKLKEEILENVGNDLSIELEFVVVKPTEKIVEQPFQPGLYPGKYIEIDLSTQRLAAFNGQNKDHEFVVSTGKWSMPTPIGTFSINNKTPRAYSATYNLYMPYWMSFIGSKYGLHALPEWANGYKEEEDHLGKPVSHGCVRLSTENAETLYNWTDIGTVVYIHK